MSVTGETSPPRLYRRVASGARDVVSADRAALLLVTDGSDREVLEAVPSATVPGDWETALMRKVRETGEVDT